MVQYSFHYKLEQGTIDIRNILKRWKQKIVPIRTLHYSTKGIVKPTWNILNLVQNQNTVNIKIEKLNLVKKIMLRIIILMKKEKRLFQFN